MKILMALVVMMSIASVYAGDCKLGENCSLEDCQKINKSYAIADGKCVDPASSEKDTHCSEIVGTSGAKATTSGESGAAADPSKNISK